MSDHVAPEPSKLPFIVSDLLLLATAGWIAWQAHGRLDLLAAGIVAACVAVGGWLAVWPFVLQHRAAVQALQNGQLLSATSQLKDLDIVARHIAGATAQWQAVHEHAGKTATTAQAIADHIGTEARNFREFIQKASEDERSHLRLEIEKLRRGEGESVQVIVRLLDHVFALHSAGVRSGQPALAEQLTLFQNACRDTVRRLGLVPLVPAPDAAFDPQTHQLLDGVDAAPGTPLEAVLATGYTYQGQLIRRPLVAPARATPAAVMPDTSVQFVGAAAPEDPLPLVTEDLAAPPSAKPAAKRTEAELPLDGPS